MNLFISLSAPKELKTTIETFHIFTFKAPVNIIACKNYLSSRPYVGYHFKVTFENLLQHTNSMFFFIFKTFEGNNKKVVKL